MAAINSIDADDRVDITYIGGRVQVAETTWDGHRLIVRRTLNLGEQPGLFEDWRHHAFVTGRSGPQPFTDFIAPGEKLPGG